MYPSAQDSSRVGQSAYWMWFGIYVVLTLAFVGFGLYEFFTGGFVAGILLILLIVPLGIYFRVIMMRRCRDINWPAFLPWAIFGCAVLANMLSPHRLGADPKELASSFGLPMVVGMLDFVFVIAIGCISSKDQFPDYTKEYSLPVRPAPDRASPDRVSPDRAAPRNIASDDQGDGDVSRWDAAIADRLAALEGRDVQVTPQRPAADEYPAVQRPLAGFGRKAV